MSSMNDVDVALWRDELDRLCARIGRRFVRAEPRTRVCRYVNGLLAGLERKNGWSIAEHAAEVSPDGMQRLLRTADWDVDAVRDDVRDYLVEHLGTPQAVLVIDDTGFVKKGGSARLGCSGSTPAPRARKTTARSGCSPPMSPRTGTP
jgi:SRSO17 transposase